MGEYFAPSFNPLLPKTYGYDVSAREIADNLNIFTHLREGSEKGKDIAVTFRYNDVRYSDLWEELLGDEGVNAVYSAENQGAKVETADYGKEFDKLIYYYSDSGMMSAYAFSTETIGCAKYFITSAYEDISSKDVQYYGITPNMCIATEGFVDAALSRLEKDREKLKENLSFYVNPNGYCFGNMLDFEYVYRDGGHQVYAFECWGITPEYSELSNIGGKITWLYTSGNRNIYLEIPIFEIVLVDGNSELFSDGEAFLDYADSVYPYAKAAVDKFASELYWFL